MKNKLNSILATVLGLLVAIANAWVTIDWTTFDWGRDYMQLVISGIIALGGFVSSINMPRQKSSDTTNNGFMGIHKK